MTIPLNLPSTHLVHRNLQGCGEHGVGCGVVNHLCAPSIGAASCSVPPSSAATISAGCQTVTTRARIVSTCFRGALPPVPLRAICAASSRRVSTQCWCGGNQRGGFNHRQLDNTNVLLMLGLHQARESDASCRPPCGAGACWRNAGAAASCLIQETWNHLWKLGGVGAACCAVAAVTAAIAELSPGTFPADSGFCLALPINQTGSCGHSFQAQAALQRGKGGLHGVASSCYPSPGPCAATYSTPFTCLGTLQPGSDSGMRCNSAPPRNAAALSAALPCLGHQPTPHGDTQNGLMRPTASWSHPPSSAAAISAGCQTQAWCWGWLPVPSRGTRRSTRCVLRVAPPPPPGEALPHAAAATSAASKAASGD